jgi:hypothetical protein
MDFAALPGLAARLSQPWQPARKLLWLVDQQRQVLGTDVVILAAKVEKN